LRFKALSLPDQRIVQAIKKALKGQLTTFEGIYESTTADKATPLRALYAPIKDSEDSVMGVVAIVEDITERKKIEDEIRTLNKELEQRVKERTINLEALNKELASFAYSISHDFRAPLRALDAFSASLNEKYNDQLDEQGRHYLKRIRNAALYMSELIDDLLKLSRITRAEVNPQEVDISRLAEERIQLLQETEPERQVAVEIATGMKARGDRALLHAALQNLLENAWKFCSKEAQAEIEVGRATIDGEEVFFVRDNGVGFSMAYADKLYAPFQRLHGTAVFPGTGIGLSIVSRIINRHGGRIWAEGEVGKGATFYFTLP
jgi:light-regulated signal transduction histidine kinase (bacteriophytochrome)